MILLNKVSWYNIKTTDIVIHCCPMAYRKTIFLDENVSCIGVVTPCCTALEIIAVGGGLFQILSRRESNDLTTTTSRTEGGQFG